MLRWLSVELPDKIAAVIKRQWIFWIICGSLSQSVSEKKEKKNQPESIAKLRTQNWSPISHNHRHLYHHHIHPYNHSTYKCGSLVGPAQPINCLDIWAI